MPHIYRLHHRQVLAMSPDDAWAFFSNPRNLEEITPDDLRFSIVSEVPERIYTGLVIQYRLVVPPGVPTGWLTEIKAVEAPRRFVDEQRFGPYALWFHEHAFRPVDGGVECRDTVHYALPFGWLGRLAHWLFVRRQLEGIFAHRTRVLAERFGEVGAPGEGPEAR
jgi:ligand-binding SRPBCC domain-containing protein